MWTVTVCLRPGSYEYFNLNPNKYSIHSSFSKYVYGACSTLDSCVENFYSDVEHFYVINPLTPNDHYSGRTAPVASQRCILYIYSTNTGTEYFKHGIYSPFLSLSLSLSLSSKCSLFHFSNVFGSSFIHILFTGYDKI